ncbi:MAG TPA: CHAP domain-containing protein [Baekduia sp.]|uniref:CHAP domain-containing protein n=1 Tax=Baekduia sp. TaxID=2600305 RepID=UPI002B60D029|nr:CHAP domain-containing protein [Baekduia sp.]HMJ33105.1 CHAP domain-containing protein [Baekduia sp.]
MSVENVMARIAELDRSLVRQPAPATGAGSTSFATMLQGQALSSTPAGAAGATGAALGFSGGTAGQRALAFAQAEVGVTEQPPGSNDAPRIAQYRQATAGSGIGPWCSYFVSWAAQQAGAPLGEAGQGFGSVDAVASWAQRTGRFNAAGSGVPPAAGDLVVWGGRHIGIVESVDPDGTIHTIEGNSSNMVTRRTHGADGDGATGYVRLG